MRQLLHDIYDLLSQRKPCQEDRAIGFARFRLEKPVVMRNENHFYKKRHLPITETDSVLRKRWGRSFERGERPVLTNSQHPQNNREVLQRTPPRRTFIENIMSNHTAQIFLHTQQKHPCLLELEAKAQSQQEDNREMLLNDSLVAYFNLYGDTHPTHDGFPSTHSLSEDLCDMELSLDDASTVSSQISLTSPGEPEDHIWTLNNYLRGQEVNRAHSWTIHIYNRNRRAGDTLWFRVWHNESDGFCEVEDTEILDSVQAIIERDPSFCFYVKMTGRGGLQSVSVFEAKLIDRAMRTILGRAQDRNRIVIPSIAELKRDELLETRKRGFWTWLLLAEINRSAGNR